MRINVEKKRREDEFCNNESEDEENDNDDNEDEDNSFQSSILRVQL